MTVSRGTPAYRTHIVRVGNSHGVRIPRPLLELTGLSPADEVEVHAEGNHLVIRPALHARAGWAEQFQAMAAQGDDRLLDAAVITPTTWDDAEWQW